MRHWNTKTAIALILWALFGLMIASASAQVIAPNEFADIARQKDIVWLSLVTGIVCISFSAWLVKQLLKQGAETVAAIRELRDELKARPCYYKPPPSDSRL